MEIKIARIEESLTGIKERLARMEKIQEEIQSLTISVNDLAQSIRHICNDVSQNNNRLSVIEEKPSKRWETLIGAIIASVVTGLMGVVIGKLL